jgi:HEAT repeat protein
MASPGDASDAMWRALVAIGEKAIPALANLVKHTNPLVRTCAARAIGNIGPMAKAAVPALKAALTDRFVEVALEAACSLCRLNDSTADAVSLVKNAIETGTMSVPAAAIEAIPRMGDAARDLLPLALSKLDDANPATRFAVVSLVGTLPATEAVKAVPAVAKRSTDPEPEVRRRVGATLERLGATAASAAATLGAALPSETDEVARNQFVDALLAMGVAAKPAVPALLPLMTDGNTPQTTRLKLISAVALADPASAEVAMQLIAIANGTDMFARRVAVLALANLKPMPADAVATLVRLAKTDASQSIRVAAMKALALAGVKAKAARADVAKIAAGDNPAPAAWGKVALAAMDGDITKAAALVRAGLSDRFVVARIVYAEALALVGPTATDVPALVAMLREKHEGAKEAAAVALGLVGSGAKDAVPALVEILDDRSGEVRAAVADALGRIGPVAAVAVPKLRETLRDPTTANAATRAIERITGNRR